MLQIRAEKNRVLLEIPVELFEEAEQKMLSRGYLELSDIKTRKYSFRSYVLAILAYKHNIKCSELYKPIRIIYKSALSMNHLLSIGGSSTIANINRHGVKVSPEQLNEMLQKEKEIDDIAEEIVWEYEKEKLKKIGLDRLVSKMRWISKEDCTAGYDIQSFDDNGCVIYIEIKASYSMGNHFILSKNELSAAKLYGDQYYIYHVRNVGRTSTMEGYTNRVLKILPNPYKLIDEKKINAAPADYDINYITPILQI